MRITNKILTGNYLKNVNRNLENMNELEDQMSSGKLIRRPSDNPYDVSRSMEVNASISRNTQYKRNIGDSQSWVDMTDEALSQISDDLQRISEILTAAANTAVNTDEEYYSYKTEIEQKIKGIIDSGNTNLNGKYIFGGHKTTKPPFEAAADGTLQYVGENGSITADKGLIYREISPNVTIDINITGDKITRNGELESALGSVLSHLNAENAGQLSDDIGKINALRDNILNLRAEVGAKSNRLEAAAKNNETYDYNMTEVLTKIEDIDITEKTIQTKVAENVYTASLMVGSKILQPSLLDFLR